MAKGFAAMNPERQREVSSWGGRAVHLNGTAHKFTPEEARAAGRKGGEATSRNREHMSAIGRVGGYARQGRPHKLCREHRRVQGKDFILCSNCGDLIFLARDDHFLCSRPQCKWICCFQCSWEKLTMNYGESCFNPDCGGKFVLCRFNQKN